MIQISSFYIFNLNGNQKRVGLQLRDNTLVLVGENGTGKTTILRILFYTLSSQWERLSTFNFTDLEIVINQESHIIKHSDIELNFNKKRSLRGLPMNLRRDIERMIESQGKIDIEIISREYSIPLSDVVYLLSGQEQSSSKLTRLNKITKSLEHIQFLYLPTYRRIEEELSTILTGTEKEYIFEKKRALRLSHNKSSSENSQELIEFGMRDVDRAINENLESFKEYSRETLNSLTLGYLGDIVEKTYLNVDLPKMYSLSDDDIDKILRRLDEKILSDSSKNHLLDLIQNTQNKKGQELSEHDKVVCHYFIKLMNFQKNIEAKERNINLFCDVCNKYMKSKKFNYDSSTFTFSINLTDSPECEINLHQLSSGEKQIVSLFSHLYLSNNNGFFVLIDEPEMSLSVKWQREFLVDIRKAEFCVGLVAVTHSPFIFENELDSYTHGIGEFYIL